MTSLVTTAHRGVGHLLTAPLVGLVRLYQLAISPLVGPRCRFEPSCSHYAIEALRRRGLGAGLVLTAWRLLRCQPWGTPGFDPVPDRGLRAHRDPLRTSDVQSEVCRDHP